MSNSQDIITAPAPEAKPNTRHQGIQAPELAVQAPTDTQSNQLCKLPMELLVNIVRHCNDYGDLKNFMEAWPPAQDAFTYPGMDLFWAQKVLVQKYESYVRNPPKDTEALDRQGYRIISRGPYEQLKRVRRFLQEGLYKSPKMAPEDLYKMGECIKNLRFWLWKHAKHCGSLEGGIEEMNETQFYISDELTTWTGQFLYTWSIWAKVKKPEKGAHLPNDLDDLWTETMPESDFKHQYRFFLPQLMDTLEYYDDTYNLDHEHVDDVEYS